jgi:hypothetical protein
VLHPEARKAKEAMATEYRLRVRKRSLVMGGFLCFSQEHSDCTAFACGHLPVLPDPHSQDNRHFRFCSAVKLESFREKTTETYLWAGIKEAGWSSLVSFH